MSLTLLSYNIRYGGAGRERQLAEAIRACDADIVLLQEATLPHVVERVVTAEGLAAVREHLARRLPALGSAPVIETRVCQYENTSNGDFLIDRHPAFENVWLVGGGSGHGFKHGPVVGEYVADMTTGRVREPEPRFALSAKGTIQNRAVY